MYKVIKNTIILACLFSLFLGKNFVYGDAPSLSFFPTSVMQGELFMVQIDGTNEVSSINKLSFDGKKIPVFVYKDKPTALVGIDLNKKAGTYELKAEFSDGTILKKSLEISKREKIETPLGIPPKLGGNTKESQDKLVATLVSERDSLLNIRTNNKALWRDAFVPPLKEIFVTDPYGFSRKTGAYSIPHKGVDYRAKVGTEVLATNRGVVRIAKTFRDYGKTIVVDHGLGVMTFYLHLSKIKVKVGDIVECGQTIALSGDTGYTIGAHLHFSVRIGNIAIDPVKFFELFQKT